MYQDKETSNVTIERYVTSKADWEVWKDCTEQKIREWNDADTQFDSVDDMAESFMNIYTECMTEAVPRKVKLQNRRRKPLWWNESVGEAISDVNKAKKRFQATTNTKQL